MAIAKTAHQLLVRDFGKPPALCDGVCCIFSISDFAPTTIVQPSMGKLMSDDVTSERLGAIFQTWLQHDTATGTGWTKGRHHHSSSAPRFAIVNGDTKAIIGKKILLDIFRQRSKHFLDATSKCRELLKWLKVCRKNSSPHEI